MSANCTDRISGMHGFTLVELVTIVVLLGILSVVVLPRLNYSSDFAGVLFRDQLVSVLRDARKAAVARRRLVCARIEPRTVSLAIAADPGATSCNQSLPLVGGAAALESTDAVVAISPASLTLYFQPGGRITADGGASSVYNASLSVGGAQLAIVGETGYVR